MNLNLINSGSRERLFYNALTPMPRTVAFVFLICACSSYGQVINSFHPAAAFPGDWLQFRSDRKLTGRSRLVGNIAPPTVASASAPGLNRNTLPALSYSSAVVNINTSSYMNSNGQTITNQAANVAFQKISTSEGLSYPKFGFIFVRAIGDTKVFLQFRPTVDSNLAGIAGLTQDVEWVVDTVHQTVYSSDLSALPLNLQHLLMAIAANLASIYAHASQVNIATANSGPVWSIADVSTLAGAVSDLIFQPSPILWSQFIGARQTSVAFQTGDGGGTINLPAANSNAGALAANATWGLGPATYDLNHNGNLFNFGIDDTAKIGNFVSGSNAFQKVQFDSAFSSCGNNATTCSSSGHLYEWQNGNWVEQWHTDPIPALFEPTTIVGDFDGDGRLEVAVEPWYNLMIYDLLTGALKQSAQFTPAGAESGRGYGWLGAFDLNGDGAQEFVVLGDLQNIMAVMGWSNGKLVKLWDHLIEASIENRQTIIVPGAYPVQDIDGDGKLEVVTSIFNESGDGQWHVVARDGMTGTVLLDLPQRSLVGMLDVDGDGSKDLLTIATNGLLLPQYGQVDVVSFSGRTVKTLLELNGVGFATQQLQNLPLNINTGDTITAPVAGPIAQGGLPVFFTQQAPDTAGNVAITAWQWTKGALANIGTFTGPRLKVLATRPAGAGTPSILITAATAANNAGSITTTGLSGTVVQSNLIPAPLSSVVVGHLRPQDPPTVVVQDALEEMVAFRPSSASGTGTVLWRHQGRGGTFGADNANGQYGFDGPLLASLTGDGTLQTLAATQGPIGQARIVAIQPDGTDFWTSDLDRFPGATPQGSQPGATLLYAGRFRSPDQEDVAAGTRRGANGTEELNLLDGRTGQLVWNDPYGNTPGTPPTQRGAGEGWMAIYDWNHDGLDEMLNYQTDVFWVKNGNDQNLIDRSFNPQVQGGGVFSIGWAFYGTPVVADFLNNGTDTLLFGASTFLFGMLDDHAKAIWNGQYQAGTPGYLPGIADLDGDGTLSLVSAGVAGSNGQAILNVNRSDTGALLWSIPLAGCGHFTANQSPEANAPTPVTVGDINGDGRDEAIFVCGSKIYVAGADAGNRSGKILWSVDLGTRLDTPILADAEGNGQLEIVVVGANGYVYGIGSQASAAGGQNAPSVPANGIVEGATFRPGQIAPGGWFSIFGSNLSDGKYQAASTPLPQQLGGTVVTVNGQIARLNYVDTGQINAEMPPDMPAGLANVVVTTKAVSSKGVAVQIVPAMPEIFQYGEARAVAQNVSDYSLNAPSNPVSAGGGLVVYFTGAGLVNGDRRTGVPASLSDLMRDKLDTTVTIAGQPAELGFAGLTPGSIGLYQVNVSVPANLSPGDYPVIIRVGGVESSPALISVK